MTVVFSHPPEDGTRGVLLKDHLEDTASRVRSIVDETSETPTGESLVTVVETLAYIHDIGKATTYFQQYIDVQDGSPDSDMYRHHAPLGAFAAYYCLSVQGFDPETCLAGFVAVGKHHGQIPDVANYIHKRSYRRENLDPTQYNVDEQRILAIGNQIEDINDNESALAEDIFENATRGNGSWDGFVSSFKRLIEEIVSEISGISEGRDPSRETLSKTCYGLVIECWGTLVLADKTSAATRNDQFDPDMGFYEPDPPSYEELESFIVSIERDAASDPDGTHAERLNHKRSQARTDIVTNAEQFAEDGGGIATLTLPTGMGKTLSGLSAALTIRDIRESKRVIYALPFTSIIDQVVDELTEIYQTDTKGRQLTAHHYLSETTIKDGEKDEDAYDEADQSDDVGGLLAEGWRAGLTVTTFVQLFESLAGPSNAQSMKLPALRNSVIILDEPQSLPLDWWSLVPRLVRILVEQYDATVISMTATQPRLFENSCTTVTELVDQPNQYFEAAERVRYQLDASVERYIEKQSDPKSYSEAASELLECKHHSDSALAVCNTIDSARTLTQEISTQDSSASLVGQYYTDVLQRTSEVEEIEPGDIARTIVREGDWATLHLSTRLRPIDRLILITIAKKLTALNHPLLVVSTQLIEAGVDISFDRVYRDLAPIDSIVQAAGRCNRSFEQDRGEVTVWWLDVPAEQTKTPAEAVYNRGPALLPVAAQTLDFERNDATTIAETSVARDAVERYYKALKEQKNVGKDQYVSYVDNVRGDKLADLSLIDKRQAFDVVICRTETDRQLRRRVSDAVSSYNFDKVQECMRELRMRQISVPVYQSDSREARELRDLERVHPETEVRYLDTSQSEFTDFFDEETGFVVPDDTIERRFL